MENTRRDILGAALAGAALSEKKSFFKNGRPASTPLFPSAVTFGNLVFVSGHGVNNVQGAKAQTTATLDQIEQILQGVGSSLKKVLKCSVFVSDIRDYAEMNEAYLGRFGADPPARTCLEVSNIPLKGCVVEIEAIAFI